MPYMPRPRWRAPPLLVWSGYVVVVHVLVGPVRVHVARVVDGGVDDVRGDVVRVVDRAGAVDDVGADAVGAAAADDDVLSSSASSP